MQLHRLTIAAVALAAGLAGTPSGAAAQETTEYQQVISANPFGLLLEVFNAEYERVISQSSTLGIGGSYFGTDDDDYLNLDAFWRFYVNGTPLEGWVFGVKAGVTRADLYDDAVEAQDDTQTYFGAGFDANYSWLLGRDDNFSIGIGFGLKRLLGADEAAIELIPTIRLVNIGIAF